ncbi:hypothetical protein HMPREF1624_08285 [Sporothrix schenckii ATCC 58251]|uniref:Uncharacterized protein n=1 Tax=Sporothrix schenckii (strain ATCC 58251 / de Perez 2211183) TaxID=1391915 RepID=U7PIR2_SPOS1|nr:hypothetical protein HMPREF1624_08285 [Sporothrix schenckii ATCC 58251]
MDLNDVHILQRRPLMGRAGVFVTGIANSATNAASNGDGLPNLNLSNGTCYSAPGKQMDSRFIPCGNAAAGIQTCCWEGDNCLSDKACFGIHDGGYSTYLAGCTDAEWDMSDPSVSAACPVKPDPYGSEPWVGLAYCGNNDTGHEQWIPCPQADSPTTMRSPGPCVCPTITQQRIVAFTDGPTLGSYASLPTSPGGSIMWFPPYSPTYAVTATDALGGKGGSSSSGGPPKSTSSTPMHKTSSTPSTSPSTTPSTLSSTSPLKSTSTSPLKTTSVSPSTSPPTSPHTPPPTPPSTSSPTSPSPSPSTSSTKNTSLIVGVSVGVVAFVVLALLGAFYFLKKARWWRQRGAADQLEGAVGGNGGPAGFGGGYMDGKPTTGADFKTMGASTFPDTYMSIAVPELENRPARPWSLRSELDGATATATAPTANKNDTRTSIGTLLSSPPASPPLMGDLYESSTVSSLHGQLTGQTTGQTAANGWNRGSQHPGAPTVATLVELEG